MSWSGFPNHPPPPPPPPHGPHGAVPPPPPPPPGPHGPGDYPPFWDFLHYLDPNYRAAGQGVDHADGFGSTYPNSFNFGPNGFEGWAGPHGFGGFWGGRGGGFGHRGRGFGRHRAHGRRCRRGHPSDEEPSADEEMRDINASEGEKGDRDPEKDDSPVTLREGDEYEYPDPPEEVPFVRSEGRGGRRGFGPRGGRRGPHGHHGPRGPHGRHHHHPPPPPYADAEGGNPFATMWQGFANHPFAQQLRQYVENARAQATGFRGENDDEFGGQDSFVPPVDIFNTPNNWTIHIALPGAKKEDIGVNWDAAKSSLVVRGVVHRPGDEEFLAGMMSGERKVGLFERSIKLPPPGEDEKEEVDGESITAKMEDGILVVTVPKAEKEWTEVRKVDIL